MDAGSDGRNRGLALIFQIWKLDKLEAWSIAVQDRQFSPAGVAIVLYSPDASDTRLVLMETFPFVLQATEQRLDDNNTN